MEQVKKEGDMENGSMLGAFFFRRKKGTGPGHSGLNNIEQVKKCERDGGRKHGPGLSCPKGGLSSCPVSIYKIGVLIRNISFKLGSSMVLTMPAPRVKIRHLHWICGVNFYHY